MSKMKKPEPAKISDTALKVGMICGLMWGVDVDALKYLIKNEEGDFRYGPECKAVLQLRRKCMGIPRGGRPRKEAP